MPNEIRYKPTGTTDPCDRCGLQTKMHEVLESADGGETWVVIQYRNPRTRKDRDARHCRDCAKEVCRVFPPVSFAQAKAAMEVLGAEKEAKAEISELVKSAEEGKVTVLRYLIQHDADQLTHGGHTAKFRTRTNTHFDKDYLEDVLTEAQLREATRITESQFVVVS